MKYRYNNQNLSELEIDLNAYHYAAEEIAKRYGLIYRRIENE